MTQPINFICRERVLAVLDAHEVGGPLRFDIEHLPSFPAPNPKQLGDRNIMGQTEDEFWDAVDAQEKGP